MTSKTLICKECKASFVPETPIQKTNLTCIDCIKEIEEEEEQE